jgi:predicted RNA-binding Zn-ribbon protein involved in translation (DUF1610 family)
MVAWADLGTRRIIGWVALGFNVLLVLLLSGSFLHVQAAIDDALRCDPWPCFYCLPDLLRERAVVLWATCLPIAIWAVSSVYRWSFRCPHCGWRFAVRRRECDRCGTRIGTPKSAVVEAERQAASVDAPEAIG